MNWLRTDVNNIRMKRKCSAHFGSWTFMLGTVMLLLTVTNVVGSDADELFDDGFNADDYSDVDNVEWHHVKIIDGVLQPEDHPVIFYKEDMVNEDYDPAKEKRKNSTATDPATVGQRPRKYKEISRRHRYDRPDRIDRAKYRAVKSEKTYFDVLPQAPIVTAADDSSADDSRFDTSKIQVEVISLADDVNVNGKEQDQEKDEAAESKQILSKRPKKYRKRQRRDATLAAEHRDTAPAEEHKVKKRNPYLVRGSSNVNLIQYLQSLYAASNRQQANNGRNSVRGNYWNTISLPDETETPVDVGVRGGTFEPDRVVWGVVPNRPLRVLPPEYSDQSLNSVNPIRTTRRPITFPPLIRDPSPENADLSFITQRPTREDSSARTTTTRRPITFPPLIRDPSPDNADLSFLNRPRESSGGSKSSQGDIQQQSPLNAPSRSGNQRQRVSQCVWAIVSCCSRENLSIRNDCFEAMDCGRNFWGLNPCADNIQGQALEYVENYLE